MRAPMPVPEHATTRSSCAVPMCRYGRSACASAVNVERQRQLPRRIARRPMELLQLASGEVILRVDESERLSGGVLKVIVITLEIPSVQALRAQVEVRLAPGDTTYPLVFGAGSRQDGRLGDLVQKQANDAAR